MRRSQVYLHTSNANIIFANKIHVGEKEVAKKDKASREKESLIKMCTSVRKENLSAESKEEIKIMLVKIQRHLHTYLIIHPARPKAVRFFPSP